MVGVTKRALIKTSQRSQDDAHELLVDSIVAAEDTIAGRRVRVFGEPLLRHLPDGTRGQSLRLCIDGLGSELTIQAGDVQVRTSGGSLLQAEVLAGPDGSVRVLVPEVTDRQQVELTLTSLDPDRSLSVPVSPQREWTIHLVHHSHLDIGYTDPQGRVRAENVNFLDSALELVEATDDWPEDARFRWVVESLWSFEKWRQVRPAATVERFVEQVRRGRIELTAMPYNLHTDTCSTDELYELLRLAHEVRTRYGLELPVAMQTNVPGTVGGLPDAFRAADVRYLSVAHNYAGRSVPYLTDGANLPRLFRWRSHSGAEVLVWMTDSPSGLAYMEGPMLGFHGSYADVDDRLPSYLSSLAAHGRPYHGDIFGWALPEQSGERDPYPWDVLHLRVQGRFADNAPPRRVIAETVRQWNETWEYPRLRLSRNEDFFAEVESRVGEKIPTFEGDWGDWWVEGTGADVRSQALTRRAQALLPQAQTLSSITTLLGGEGPDEAQEWSREGYQAISMFNEHTWGAGNPWQDADLGMGSGVQQRFWKTAWALRAHDGAQEFLDAATAGLGALLPAAPEALTSYYLLNTSAFARSGVAEIFLPASRVPEEVTIAVQDSRTGAELPTDVLEQINPNHRNAGRRLRVLVEDVPACGFLRVDIMTRAAEGPEPAQPGESAELENEHLRVRVDLRTATIASIIERASGRELVNQDSTVGFNGYVYDSYTMAGGFNHASSQMVVSDKLELLGGRALAEPAVLIERVSTATEERLVYEHRAEGVRWLRVTLRLPHGSPVLHIENRLSKPATMAKESAFIAFPFAAQEPQLRYEISGSVTGAGLDHVPGAPQQMRAVRSWVSVAGTDGAAAWATGQAHLVQPEVIALPYAPFPDSTSPRRPGTIYSSVHNNLWDTKFPSDQGFEMSFHYAVGLQRAGAPVCPSALAMRTAAELTAPLVSVPSGALAGSGELVAARSLLEVDDDQVQLVGLVAGAEPGQVLVRLQSFADSERRVHIRPGVSVQAAAARRYLGDPAETLVQPSGGVEVTLPRLGTAAVLLQLE